MQNAEQLGEILVEICCMSTHWKTHIVVFAD